MAHSGGAYYWLIWLVHCVCSENSTSTEESRLCDTAFVAGPWERTDDLQSFRQPHGYMMSSACLRSGKHFNGILCLIMSELKLFLDARNQSADSDKSGHRLPSLPGMPKITLQPWISHCPLITSSIQIAAVFHVYFATKAVFIHLFQDLRRQL